MGIFVFILIMLSGLILFKCLVSVLVKEVGMCCEIMIGIGNVGFKLVIRCLSFLGLLVEMFISMILKGMFVLWWIIFCVMIGGGLIVGCCGLLVLVRVWILFIKGVFKFEIFCEIVFFVFNIKLFVLSVSVFRVMVVFFCVSEDIMIIG